jgi:hypothetical protein
VYDGEQHAKLAVDDELRCGGDKILALDSVVVSILFFSEQMQHPIIFWPLRSNMGLVLCTPASYTQTPTT